MLAQANQRLSLVGHSTLPEIWTRHFLDSAQLLPLMPDPEKSVVDIGTGAGFPGVVLAIMGLPHIHLIEHNMQKVAFLRTVIGDLGLKATLHAMKVQAVKPFLAGVVTARALKPLSTLLVLAKPFLGPATACIFPKGRQAAAELAEVTGRWRMKIESFPSMTGPDSTIFRLSEIAEVWA